MSVDESKVAKVTAADVDAKLAELAATVEKLEAGLPDLIGQKAEEIAGPIVGKLVEEALAPLAAQLEDLTAKGEKAAEGLVGEADAELHRFVDHVNAKVHAIHNALQRAVGIEVPLPQLQDTAGTPVGEITVAGAETASAQP